MIVIEYILGAFSGGFLVFMLMSVFMGRPAVTHEKGKGTGRAKLSSRHLPGY